MTNKKHFIKLIFLCTVLLAVLTFSSLAASIGDVDGNGKIEAADARLALRASVNLEKFAVGSEQFHAADVDNDNAITSADARLILRVSVNLDKFGHIHTYGAWVKETKSNGIATGNHYRVCSCGDKQVEACKFGDKVYTSSNTKPTCTQSTKYYIECSVCGNKKAGGEAALGHTYVTTASTPATCTLNGTKTSKCKTCGTTKTDPIPAKGHKCKGQNFSINAPIKCTVCNETVLPSFNELANTLKNGTHRFTSFEYDLTSGDIKKNDLKLHPLLQSFLGDEFNDMMAESFSEKTESYTGLIENRAITNFSFPLTNTAKVSELKDGDVVSLTVTPINSIDFVNELPATAKIYVTSNSYRNYDMSSVKTNATHKVNKVEVILPQEKYSSFKSNSTETALMRITDIDIRELAQTISEESSGNFGEMEGAETKMSMKLNELATDFTLIYYFDAVTNEPLAAVYDLCFSADEHIEMALSMDMSEIIPGTGTANIIEGTMDMVMKSQNRSYYFFDGYFK